MNKSGVRNTRTRTAFGAGVIVALVMAFACGRAMAVTYKWIDENGRVVYGDTPPAGVKAERVVTGTAPADPAAVRDLAAKDAEINKRMQQRSEAEAKADKDRVDVNLRRSQCQQATGRIKSLREDANVFRYNEKGERVYFTAAERESSIAQNQKIMRDLGCTPALQP